MNRSKATRITRYLTADCAFVVTIIAMAVSINLVEHGAIDLALVAKHVWAWVAHTVSDVASAEVIVLAVTRLFGVAY